MVIQKLLLSIIFTFVFLIFSDQAFASTLSLSPVSGSIELDDIKTVQVRLNTQGEAVNGVSAFISYPQDKLEVVWITYGSAFNIAAEGAHGGGVIKISRGNITGVTGNVTVATIGFRGKALGSANVSFMNGSAVPLATDSSDSLNLGASSGGVFNIVPVANDTPTASPTTSSTPTKDLVPPVISDIKITNISTNSATINWKTDEKSTSYIEFGLENNYFLNAADTDLVTDHSVKLESPVFIPGNTYFFLVKSVDESNNLATSSQIQFRLVGYQVLLRIVGDELPSTSQVFIQGQLEKPVISQREVHFESLPPGKHVIVIKADEQEKTHEIEVINSSIPQVFDIPFQTKTANFIANRNKAYVTIFAVLIGVLSILAPVVMVVLKRKRHKFLHHPHHQPDKHHKHSR